MMLYNWFGFGVIEMMRMKPNKWAEEVKTRDLIYFLILSIFSGSLLFYRYQVQVVRGPGRDTFAFLANALSFAGEGTGYSEPHRPPFLSWLVSIVFRLGWVSERAIFFVDAFLLLFGVLGFYLLLRQRFSPLWSFAGSLLFLSFPVVAEQAATGYTDLASISFSIWSIYFFILGRKEGRGFLWGALFFVAAVLTRFTALLLVFPVLFLLLAKPTEKAELKTKKVFHGALAALAFYLPFGLFYLRNFGNPLFPFAVAFGVISSPSLAAESFAYEPDLSWYLVNLTRFVSGGKGELIFFPLAFISLTGLIFYFYRLLRLIGREKFFWVGVLNLTYFLIFIKGGLILRQFGILFLSLFLYFLFRKEEERENYRLWLFLIFLSWFLVYFDFHSHQGVKVARYFLVMAPGFTYLLLAGLEEFTRRLSLKPYPYLSSLFVLILLSFFLSSNFFASVRRIKPEPDYLVADARKASQWLERRNLSGKVIYSDLWPVFSWYLKREVLPMPSFKDPRAFNHELVKNRADYFLTIRERQLPSFRLIKKVGSVKVYGKVPRRFYSRPRLLYLGQNWQNYLEEVLGFKYFLIYEVGRYGLGRTTYLDNFTLKELKEYPLIFLYNFRFHSLQEAQKLLLDYLKDGGSLIVDLSANLGGFAYNLEGRSFLGVVAERKALKGKVIARLAPELGGNEVSFSPFVSEEGGEWHGASYWVVPGSGRMKSLVEADGKSLISLQQVGKGRIYWIGYNLIWHAFLKENLEERRLIQNLVELALKERVERKS